MDQLTLIERGKTYYGPTDTIPSTYGQSVMLEGHTKEYVDRGAASGGGLPTFRSGRTNVMMIVRNVSGITLLPGMAVKWKAAYRGRRVDGYSYNTGMEVAGFVDDQISATYGVRNGDLFLLIVRGPALVRTPTAGDGTNTWTEGDLLIASTGTITGNTTGGTATNDAGHVQPISTFTVTQTSDGTAAKYIANIVGRAMSAATVANSNTQKLIDVKLL